MSPRIDALLAGKAKPFRGEEKSAFAKHPVDGRVNITKLGIDGDEQADRKVHGGPEMAIHLYPLDHHEHWRSQIGDHRLLDDPGGFGSNIALRGLTEDKVCIGDRFRVGTALLEISQPRQPCWKIEHRFNRKDMVASILKSGRSGWYFRVVEEGEAQAGDKFEKAGEADHRMSVLQVFMALVGAPKDAARPTLKQLAEMPSLTARLREKARARLD